MTMRIASIPKRWEMILLIFSGIVVVYTLRVNMSVAAQKMRIELDWTETEKGFVLSAFYWGYAIGQIPSSRIAQLHGAKWLFGWSVFLPAVFTMLVPVCSRSSLTLAILVRVAIGFFESATFPAIFHFIPIWIANDEKTTMVPLIGSGMYFGEIIGFALSGFLADSTIMLGGSNIGGWPSIFYVFGLMGIVWFPVWALFAHESPDTHPRISAEEYEFVMRGKKLLNISPAAGGSGTLNPLRSSSVLSVLGITTLRQSISASSSLGTTANSAVSRYGTRPDGKGQDEGSAVAINPADMDTDTVAGASASAACSARGQQAGPDFQPFPAYDHSDGVAVNNPMLEMASVSRSVSGKEGTSMEQKPVHGVITDPSTVNSNDSRDSKHSKYDADGLDHSAQLQGSHNHPPVAVAEDGNQYGCGARSGGNTGENLEHGDCNDYDVESGECHESPGVRCGQTDGARTAEHGAGLESTCMTAAEYAARTPWRAFFTHRVSRSLFGASFAFAWIGFTLLSELPSYLTDELGFDLQSAGFLSVFPYLALFISTLSIGRLFTYLQLHHGWTVTMVRQRAMLLAYMGSGIMLVICGFLNDRYAAFAFLILTQVCYSGSQSGWGCAFSDVAPNYSTSLNTIGNTIGAVAGILGPIIVAALTEAYPGAWGWRAAFLLTLLICCAATALWMLFMEFTIIPELNTPASPAGLDATHYCNTVSPKAALTAHPVKSTSAVHSGTNANTVWSKV